MQKKIFKNIKKTEFENPEYEKNINFISEKLIKLTEISRYILIEPDINDYILLNTLQEINLDKSKFLDIVIYCLNKQKRSDEECKIIYSYLFFMKEFVNIFKKQNNINYKELIENVSEHLDYISYDKNRLICKYGDKGKKAFILLNGSINILIQNKKNYNITEKDFHLYLATLIKYNEFGLLVNVIKENYSFYPFEIIDDYEEMNKQLKKKKASRRVSVSSTSSKITISSIKPFNIKNLIEDFIPETRKKENEEVKTITLSYLNNLFNENNNNFEEYNLTHVSTEDYIKRIKVYSPINDKEKNNENEKIINAIIFEYKLIVTKYTGSLLGDFALSDKSYLRTATMISNNKCEMGVLNKKSYDICIKNVTEKQRRQTINLLLSFPIFKGLNYYTINKKYFNNFILCFFNKGNKIIQQFDFVNNVFLIKEGNFDISIKISYNEIIEIIKYYIEKINDKEQIKDIMKYISLQHFKDISDLRSYFGPDKFKKFMEEKHYFKLFTFSSLEIIGIDTYINLENGNSFFEIECSSVKGETLKLSKEFLNQIIFSNFIVKKNNFDVVQEKNIKFIHRLMILRETLFHSFYIHQSKKTGIKIENEIENEISLEKNIKIYKNGKRNFSFSNTLNNFKNKPTLLKKENLKKKKFVFHSHNQTYGSLKINSKIKRRNFPSIEKKLSNDNKFQSERSKKNINNVLNNENDLNLEISKIKKSMFQTFIESTQKYKNNSIDEKKVRLNDMIWENLDFNKYKKKTRNISLNPYFLKINKYKNGKNKFFSDLSSNDFTNYDNTDKNCVLAQEKKILNYKLIKPELIRIRKKGRIYYDEMRQLQIKLLNKKYN